jgi:hypothetical protein
VADEPAVGGAQLVDVAFDRGGRVDLGSGSEPRGRLLGLGERPSGVAVSCRVQRLFGVETFATVVADGVEHRVAPRVRAALLDEEGAVEQSQHRWGHRGAIDLIAGGDGSRGLQIERSAKHRESVKDSPLERFQLCVGPVNDGAERAVSGRAAGAAGEDVESLAERPAQIL